MKKHPSPRHTGVVILSAVVCLLILTAAYCLLLQHDIAQEQERCRYIAENEAQHIVTTVDCVMARTTTLITLVQDHGGDTEFFQRVAGEIYHTVIEETGISLKNIAIAPGGVVSDVYPLAGNEALVGFDFLDTSQVGNMEAKAAYEQGVTILTNPFALVQGGIGMAGRAPVILHDGAEQTLWGLVTVTIDFDNLIDVLQIGNLAGMGMEHALSYIDDDGSAQLIHGGGVGADAVTTRFAVRNLTWGLSVSPKSGWILTRRAVTSGLVIFALSIFAGLFADMVLRLRESNRELTVLSYTDKLTNLPNRRSYEEAQERLRHEAPPEQLVIMAADVNGLKHANDTLGHEAGDELISGAADCLRDCFGEYGGLFRVGGDEFAGILTLSAQELAAARARLAARLADWRGAKAGALSLACGFAAQQEFPGAGVSELTRTADKRMYDDKAAFHQRSEAPSGGSI